MCSHTVTVYRVSIPFPRICSFTGSPPYPPRRLYVKIYRMGFRRASHAVYDCEYHLVWCPKYRKKLFGQEYLRKRAKELFREIAEEYAFIIEESEVAADHVQILGIFSSKVFNQYRAKDPGKYQCPQIISRASVLAQEILERRTLGGWMDMLNLIYDVKLKIVVSYIYFLK